jgi:uncharacterized protein YkwD
MGVRSAAAIAAVQLVLLAFCSSSSASVACPADQTRPTVETAWDGAAALVCDINVFRGREGLRPLRWDWRLWAGAQRLANDMAGRRYFAHVTPEGKRLVDRIMPTGYVPNSPDWLLAENLGFGTNQLSPPLAVALGWMDSPGHRGNLMDPALEDIGVGIAWGALEENGAPGIYYVADFGTRGTIATSVRARARARAHARRARRR